MATHGTGSKMAKKDRSHQKIFYGNASHGGEKRAIVWFPGISIFFFFDLFLFQRARATAKRAKKIKPIPLRVGSFL